MKGTKKLAALFHPEKSRKVSVRLLKNFVELAKRQFRCTPYFT